MNKKIIVGMNSAVVVTDNAYIRCQQHGDLVIVEKARDNKYAKFIVSGYLDKNMLGNIVKNNLNDAEFIAVRNREKAIAKCLADRANYVNTKRRIVLFYAKFGKMYGVKVYTRIIDSQQPREGYAGLSTNEFFESVKYWLNKNYDVRVYIANENHVVQAALKAIGCDNVKTFDYLSNYCESIEKRWRFNCEKTKDIIKRLSE